MPKTKTINPTPPAPHVCRTPSAYNKDIQQVSHIYLPYVQRLARLYYPLFLLSFSFFFVFVQGKMPISSAFANVKKYYKLRKNTTFSKLITLLFDFYYIIPSKSP